MEFVDMRELQKLYGGLGEFEIHRHDLYTMEPEELQALMFGLIVISAEPSWDMDRIVYRAFCPDFDEVELGAMIPKYVPVLTKAYDFRHRENDSGCSYTVEWQHRA
jgi:hypothetical protein